MFKTDCMNCTLYITYMVCKAISAIFGIFHLYINIFGNLDPYATGLEVIGMESFHMRCQRRILHIRWHDYISNNEVLRRTGLLAASRTVRSCCQACWWCTSKSDPSDLLRSTKRCPAMFRLEACPRPTSYHLDSADLQRWEATAKRFACRKEGLTYWLFLNTRDERKLH